MGHRVSSLLLCRRPAQLRILMIGLDAAGKTSLLYRLKTGDLVNTIPSIGFNVETLRFENKATLTIWDVGGRCKMREMYRHYIDGTNGMIYVIDSTDQERLSESLDEIKKVAELLTTQQMAHVPLAVLCNKTDLPNSAVADMLAAVQALKEDCPDLRQMAYNCFAVSAAKGEGLTEALNWLVEAASKKDTDEIGDVKHSGKDETVTGNTLEMGWSGLYRMVKSLAMR